MTLISSPIGRAGSKIRQSPWILSVISHVPHRNWGEIFAGSCGVTINKQKRQWEFLNDKDKWIAGFLRVLRNPRQTADLLRRLKYTAWEKEDFECCTKIIKGQLPSPEDPVELARTFLVNNCMSFDKSGRTFSVSESTSGTGKWKRIHEHIEAMVKRIKDCTIFNLDYTEVLELKQVDDPQTLVYADPPYVEVEKNYYQVNKGEGFDHHAFRQSLDKCKASLLISYADHEMIRDLYRREDGWITKEADFTRSLGNSGKRARELLLVRRSPWSIRQRGGFSEAGIYSFEGLEGEPLLN